MYTYTLPSLSVSLSVSVSCPPMDCTSEPLPPCLQELVDAGLSSVPSAYIRPPHERFIPPSHDLSSNAAQIPVIDISALTSSQHRHLILQRIREACTDWGFFQANSFLFIFIICLYLIPYVHIDGTHAYMYVYTLSWYAPYIGATNLHTFLHINVIYAHNTYKTFIDNDIRTYVRTSVHIDIHAYMHSTIHTYILD